MFTKFFSYNKFCVKTLCQFNYNTNLNAYFFFYGEPFLRFIISINIFHLYTID